MRNEPYAHDTDWGKVYTVVSTYYFFDVMAKYPGQSDHGNIITLYQLMIHSTQSTLGQ